MPCFLKLGVKESGKGVGVVDFYMFQRSL